VDRAAVTPRTLAPLVLALAACSRRDDAAPAPAGPTRLVVAFTGEDLGRVEPCGCKSAMLGGLARRPARLAACVEPGVPFVYVSGGRLVAGDDEYDRMRLRAILRALRTMGCAAYAPSRTDAALVFDNFDAFAGFPTTVDGPIKLPTGDVAAFAVGAGPKSSSVRTGLPAGAAVVVLTDMDVAAARALAKTAAGPTLILYAGGRAEPRDADVVAGSVAVAPYPARGEFVGVARLVGEGASATWTVEYRPVLHDLPEDPVVAAQRGTHLAEMRAADLVRKSSAVARFAVGAAPPADDRFVGSGECADCHAGAAKAWTESKHARSMSTLSATGDDVDPGCVRCHVTAYGTGRGFVDGRSSPHLADVGCESCHGPRGVHVDARRAGRADPRRPPTRDGSCVGCHDGEHDPDFEFAPYWARIVHDGK